MAYLTLADGWQRRVRVAGTLWPDKPDRRALANLRTMLWRLATATADCPVECRAISCGYGPRSRSNLIAARECAIAIHDSGDVPETAPRAKGSIALRSRPA